MRLIATAHSKHVAAMAAVVIGLAFVAGVNFILSFAGLYDFGDRLSQFPLFLPAFVPIGVDGLAVASMGGIFMMRHAPLRVRAFCWLVFAASLVASIAGNVSHAVTQHLHIAAQVGSAVWPIFVALATHLLVVIMRHVELATLEVASGESATTPKRQSWVVKNDTSDIKKTTRQVPKQVVAIARRDDNPERDYATQRAHEGATVAQILQELVAKGSDTSRRNVERWTKQIRDNLERNDK